MAEPLHGSPYLTGSGAMASAIRAFDWEHTPLGPISAWSNSLRNVVNLVVTSRHPMFLWWGPELIQFYNDAYRPSLGVERNLVALGARGAEFWAEIWPIIGPQIEAVMQRGEATWNEEHLVPITRNGRVEEVYWTYGYSPVWDDDGRVGGTLVVVQEQTARTLASRRIRTVRDLASTVSVHRTENEAWLAGLDVLSANVLDLPWVLGFAASDDRHSARLIGQRPLDVVPETRLLQELYLAPGGAFRRVLDTGEPEVVHDLRALVGDVIVPPWPEPVVSVRLIPLRRPRSSACYGLLAVGLSPRLPFDEAYADFLTMAADQFANAIANARAHEEEQHLVDELAQTSVRFRELLEQAPAGVAVFSGPDHRFELANPNYRAITHRSDMIGRPFLEVFPELAGTALASTMDRVYRTGEPYVADEYLVELDRAGNRRLEEFYYSFNFAPIRQAGVITGLIVVAIDVTLQVKARREIADAQERLNFTLSAAGVGYWDLDLRSGAASCSPRHYQMFGYTEAPAIWTFESLLSHVDAGDRSRLAAAFTESTRTGADLDLECSIQTTAGEHRWIHVYARVERMRGRPVRLLGIVHDVTERHDLLAREQQARRNAEQASHAKDQFLASLSHELRTPMNTIIGWTDLLFEGALSPEDERSGLATIQRHARLQARLIEDLLDMSRIVSGKIHLAPRLVRLASVLEAAVEAVARAASLKGVTIVVKSADEAALVEGDATLLQQVFWNLLGNAVKFTSAGGTVVASLERRTEGMAVTVHDTGEGISAEFLPHVFERFRQEDGTSTRTHPGLGIGLSIVKQLVEAHGGTMRAASSGRGKGAAFTVMLPEASADVFEADVAAPPARRDGARVLVVEDDPETRELIRLILVGANANVVGAQSAAEALGAMSHQRFDLLVSDIGMPHEDGYEFIRKVRSLPAARGGLLPALALTAYGRPEDRERALAAGFQMHATKPLEPAGLLRACVSLLLAEVTRQA
ncbi:MAG: PAS domain-containing protein [Vicinamibacterales bacterium]